MDSQEKALLADYTNLKPSLIEWATLVDATLIRIVGTLHSESNFIQMPPNHRCKNDDSFLKKALYREKDYANPLIDIEDKVATRIVVVTSHNVYKVKEIILKADIWNFRISKDILEVNEENPNHFDYQSVHIILWPKQSILGIEPSYLTCEVQIRTLLQHSYAEVTHDSVYKGPYKNNSAIRRNLAKCMALMETTDDMFCQIYSTISMAEETDNSEVKRFVIDLTNLYNTLFNRNIDYRKLDSNFTDSLFTLLNKKPVTIEELYEYCSDHEELLRAAIDQGQSIVFDQPVILVAFYYADYYPDFINEEWMLTSTLLRKIKAAINLSSGSY